MSSPAYSFSVSWVNPGSAGGLRRMDIWALEPRHPCPEFLCSWPSRSHHQGDTRQHFRALAEIPHSARRRSPWRQWRGHRPRSPCPGVWLGQAEVPLEAVEGTPSTEPLPGSVAWPGRGPPAAPGTRHGLKPHPDGETEGTLELCLFHWPLS